MKSKELEFIQELGECQFKTEEVELILEKKMSKEEEKAYRRGILMGEYEVRKTILQMSKQGSTPAIKEFLELIASRKQEKDW